MSSSRAIYQSLQASTNLIPKQEHLNVRLYDYLTKQIKEQFGKENNTPIWTQRDALALERIATNKLEERFGPSQDSKIVAFLPSESRYQLLSTSIQDDLDKKSSMDYLFYLFQRKVGLGE